MQLPRFRGIVGTPNFLHLAGIAKDVVGLTASDFRVERLIVGGEPGGATHIRAAPEEAGATAAN